MAFHRHHAKKNFSLDFTSCNEECKLRDLLLGVLISYL